MSKPGNKAPKNSVLKTGCGISDQVFGIHNAKCFGAKGDGVTDDTAAIQVAIEAVPQIDLLPGVKAYDGSPLGGAVYFPSDVYRVTKTLTLRKGLRFHGAGPYARAE